MNTFKTAHEQLFIDQQNRNKRGGGGGAPARVGGGGLSRNYQGGGGGGSNEINFASYGGVKKSLGTRPGPASGFKPPVKQVPTNTFHFLNNPAAYWRVRTDDE